MTIIDHYNGSKTRTNNHKRKKISGKSLNKWSNGRAARLGPTVTIATKTNAHIHQSA